MRFASALLFGLLISSFSMASEALALIDTSSNQTTSDQTTVSAEATALAEAAVDSWDTVTLNSIDGLMGQNIDSKEYREPKELSEAEEEVNALPIPEPAAAAILLAGLGSMGWMRYRLG